jgi:hypothetical protein
MRFRELLVEKDVVLLKENILAGIAAGLYRKDVNADLMARYRIETSLMSLQPTLMVSTRNDLMSIAMEIGEHFMYGIMTPEGIEQYLDFKAKYIKKP